MSRKDDQIAELELERVNLRAELRAVNARVEVYVTREKSILIAMLIRAAREIGEPRLRASILEELETLIPDALDELHEDQRPAGIRRRLP